MTSTCWVPIRWPAPALPCYAWTCHALLSRVIPCLARCKAMSFHAFPGTVTTKCHVMPCLARWHSSLIWCQKVIKNDNGSTLFFDPKNAKNFLVDRGDLWDGRNTYQKEKKKKECMDATTYNWICVLLPFNTNNYIRETSTIPGFILRPLFKLRPQCNCFHFLPRLWALQLGRLFISN